MQTLLFSFSSPMNPNEFDNCKVIVPLFCEVPVPVGPCMYNGAKLRYIVMGRWKQLTRRYGPSYCDNKKALSCRPAKAESLSNLFVCSRLLESYGFRILLPMWMVPQALHAYSMVKYMASPPYFWKRTLLDPLPPIIFTADVFTKLSSP